MTEQPIAPIRQSNFSDAVTIGALNTKLNESNTDLARWKVNVQGDVIPTHTGFGVKLNIYKENGQGFIWTIPTEDVEYYLTDPSGLVDDIAEQVYEQLLKDQIKNELTTLVSRGIRNAAQRNAQSKS